MLGIGGPLNLNSESEENKEDSDEMGDGVTGVAGQVEGGAVCTLMRSLLASFTKSESYSSIIPSHHPPTLSRFLIFDFLLDKSALSSASLCDLIRTLVDGFQRNAFGAKQIRCPFVSPLSDSSSQKCYSPRLPDHSPGRSCCKQSESVLLFSF